MHEFTLEPTTQDDESFLRELFFDVRSGEFAAAGLQSAQLAMILDMQLRVRDETYSRKFPKMMSRIVRVGDRRVGNVLTDFDTNGLHLVDISLISEARGKGIGSAVIDHLKTESNRITLVVFVNNSGARRLYDRLGFIETGSEAMYLSMEWKNDGHIRSD